MTGNGPTLRVNRDDGGGVRDDGVVSVVVHLPAVELEAAGEDGVGDLAGIAEGGRQAADLAAHHDNLVLHKARVLDASRVK